MFTINLETMRGWPRVKQSHIKIGFMSIHLSSAGILFENGYSYQHKLDGNVRIMNLTAQYSVQIKGGYAYKKRGCKVVNVKVFFASYYEEVIEKFGGHCIIINRVDL